MGIETVFEQILVIFLLMAVGYVAVKLGILSASSSRDITVFIISFVIPAVILTAFMKPMEKAEIHGLLLSLGLNILYFVIIIFLAPLVFHKGWIKDEAKRIQMSYAFTYSNNGFMGLPLLIAVFGSGAGFYAGVQVAIANGFMWSHGIGIFRKASGERVSILKVVSNPNIVALSLALIIYFFKLPVPSLVKTTLGYVAQLNTPLSMIIVGSSIAMIEFKGIAKDLSLWLMVFLRNFVIPLVVLSFFYLFGESLGMPPLAMSVIVVMSACPVAAMVTMMSKLYGFDEAYPTKLISLSTLVSLVSLPMIILLCMTLLF